MRPAISFGWLTSERCPESTSMVVAFIRFARKRCRSGLIVRSCFETAYHDGLDRHAATVVFSLVSVATVDACTAYSTRDVAGATPFAKSLKNAASLSCANPSVVTTPALAGGDGNVLARATKSSPASGARAATYTSAETLGSSPASLTMVPDHECPARTVGPCSAARARRVAATLSASVVSGFWTDVT